MIKKTYLFLLLVFIFNMTQAQPPQKKNTGSSIIGGHSNQGESIPVPRFNHSSLIYYFKNHKYGLKVNDSIITKPIYDKVQVNAPTGFIVQQNGLYGFVNKAGETVIPVKYKTISRLGASKFFLRFEKNGLYGAMDHKGQEHLSPKYDKVLNSNDIGQFHVEDNAGNQDLIQKNKKVLKHHIEQVALFANGAIAAYNGKYGWIGSTKKTAFIYDVMPESNIRYKRSNSVKKGKYRTFYSHSLNSLVVGNDNKLGIIDTLGNLVVPIEHDNIVYDKYRSLYTISTNKKKGIYSIKGNKYILPEYEKIIPSRNRNEETYLLVIKDRKSGLISSRTGKFIIPLEYNQIRQVNGLFEVTKDYKKGLFDAKTGKFIIPLEFDSIYKLGKLFKVSKNQKKGIYNAKGKELFPTQFSSINKLRDIYSKENGSFYEVEIDKKVGVINRKGIVIPVEYDRIFVLNKMFLVQKGKKRGLFNQLGQELQSLIHDHIFEPNTKSCKIIFTNKDGKNGVISSDGITIYENIFEQRYTIPDTEKNLRLHRNGYGEKMYHQALKHPNGKHGVIDEVSGKLNLPFEYDGIHQHIRDNYHGKTYFLVSKRKKFGVVDEKNNIVLKIKYKAIDMAFYRDKQMILNKKHINFIVQKNGQVGVLDITGKVIVPLKYSEIKKLNPYKGLLKAKKDKHYLLLSNSNKILNEGPFDDISNFGSSRNPNNWNEYIDVLLTFQDGKMREMNQSGKLITSPVVMQQHHGFETVKELNLELQEAMNSPNDSALYHFAKKIAPSEHLVYFLKNTKNGRLREQMEYLNYQYIISKYYEQLLYIKNHTWKHTNLNDGHFYKEDYTIYESGIEMHAKLFYWSYGQLGMLDKFVKNGIKINGYWISSYFLRPEFR